jgi:flagellar biogenesis protein FliO
MIATLLALALATAPDPAPAATPAPVPAPTAIPAPAAFAIPAGGPSMGASVLLPALLLAGLAAAALLLSRKRARRPRFVEILESSSLGPRRSLVVARLGDELLLLGSSEGGITLLTTAPAPAAARAPAPDPGPAPARGLGLLGRLRLAPQRTPAPVFDSLLADSLEDVELRRKLAAGQAGSVR